MKFEKENKSWGRAQAHYKLLKCTKTIYINMYIQLSSALDLIFVKRKKSDHSCLKILKCIMKNIWSWYEMSLVILKMR